MTESGPCQSPLLLFMGLVDIQKIRVLVEPVLQELGLDLVELRQLTEYGRPTLRVAIDKEGGVTVGDCQRVSREIDTLLEVEAGIRERFFLEVSSPGLDRPLNKEADFVRFVGRSASVKTREPIEGRRNYKGLLKGVADGTIVMVIDGREYKIPVGLVERAHLC